MRTKNESLERSLRVHSTKCSRSALRDIAIVRPPFTARTFERERTRIERATLTQPQAAAALGFIQQLLLLEHVLHHEPRDIGVQGRHEKLRGLVEQGHGRDGCHHGRVRTDADEALHNSSTRHTRFVEGDGRASFCFKRTHPFLIHRLFRHMPMNVKAQECTGQLLARGQRACFSHGPAGVDCAICSQTCWDNRVTTVCQQYSKRYSTQKWSSFSGRCRCSCRSKFLRSGSCY